MMEYLELNIEKISLLGIQKRDENFRFRSFLKTQSSSKIDKIVHRLNDEISAEIDCQTCGNCCKELKPGVNKVEIKRLAAIDNVSPDEFVSNYVDEDDFADEPFLKDSPCKYLKEKSCSIYESRPKDCKSFPHTHKKDFSERTIFMIENYGICPIVFNIFERLKHEMHFRVR